MKLTTVVRFSHRAVPLVICICSLLAVLSGMAQAQGVWHHAVLGSFGTAFSRAIIVDHHGNVVIAGATSQPGHPNLLQVAKFDSSGNLLWERTHSEVVSYNGGMFAAIDSNDNIYTVASDAEKGPIITSFRPDGSFRTQEYAPSIVSEGISLDVSGIAMSPADDLYISGYVVVIDPILATTYDIGYLTKLHGGLQAEWTVPLANHTKIVGMEEPVVVDHSGNVVAASVYRVGTNSYGGFTKFSPSGEQLATGVVDSRAGVGWSYIYDLAVDQNDNIYLAGEYRTLNPPYLGPMLTAKFSGTGAFLWKQGYIGTSLEGGAAGMKIVVDSKNNVVTAGFSYAPGLSAGSIRTVVKYDADGNRLWDNRSGYHHHPVAVFTALLLDSNDNIITNVGSNTGFVDSLFSVAVTTKFDSSGSLIWDQRYNGAPSNQNFLTPEAAAIDPASSAVYTLSWLLVGNSSAWMVMRY